MKTSETLHKIFCIGVIAVSALAIAANIWFGFEPMSQVGHKFNTMFFHGIDFQLRLNEIDCLRAGTDPADVWTEKVDLPPFYPFIKDPGIVNGLNDTYNRPINLYTPWEYTYMMPLTFVSRNMAWCIHIGFKYLSLVFIGLFVFGTLRRFYSTNLSAIAVAFATLLVITFPTWRDLENGNFGLTITAALLAMSWCLDKRHDILAGILLSFAMFKPQMALLFCVPLLIRRRLIPLFTAAAICIVGCIPASILCHTSIIKLIMESVSGCDHAIFGFGILPYPLFQFIINLGISTQMLTIMGSMLGLIICTALSWKLRHLDSWLLAFVPAACCSVAWTYTGWSNYCINAFVFVGFAILMQLKASMSTRALFCIAVPWLACWCIGLQETAGMCSGILWWWQWPQSVNLTLSSFECTVILLIGSYVTISLASLRDIPFPYSHSKA